MPIKLQFTGKIDLLRWPFSLFLSPSHIHYKSLFREFSFNRTKRNKSFEWKKFSREFIEMDYWHLFVSLQVSSSDRFTWLYGRIQWYGRSTWIRYICFLLLVCVFVKIKTKNLNLWKLDLLQLSCIAIQKLLQANGCVDDEMLFYLSFLFVYEFQKQNKKKTFLIRKLNFQNIFQLQNEFY